MALFKFLKNLSLLSKPDIFLFCCAIDTDLDKLQAVLDKRLESLCTFQMNFKIFPALLLEKWLEISIAFCLKYILERVLYLVQCSE